MFAVLSQIIRRQGCLIFQAESSFCFDAELSRCCPGTRPKDCFDLFFYQKKHYGHRGMLQSLCRIFPEFKWGRLSQNHIVHRFSGVRSSELSLDCSCQTEECWLFMDGTPSQAVLSYMCASTPARAYGIGRRETDKQTDRQIGSVFMTVTLQWQWMYLKKLPAAAVWLQSD